MEKDELVAVEALGDNTAGFGRLRSREKTLCSSPLPQFCRNQVLDRAEDPSRADVPAGH